MTAGVEMGVLVSVSADVWISSWGIIGRNVPYPGDNFNLNTDYSTTFEQTLSYLISSDGHMSLNKGNPELAYYPTQQEFKEDAWTFTQNSRMDRVSEHSLTDERHLFKLDI